MSYSSKSSSRKRHYIYQGMPSHFEEQAKLRHSRRSRYLKERYGESEKKAPFLHGYSRRGFKTYKGVTVSPATIKGRTKPRMTAPEPKKASQVKEYVDYLRKTHEPQEYWVPPNLIDEAYGLRPTELRRMRGASNYRKYKRSNVPFCGTSGSSLPNTFPVDTYRHWRSGLSRARNAPDPEGIRDCLYKVASRNNWIGQSDVWSKYPRKSSRKSSKYSRKSSRSSPSRGSSKYYKSRGSKSRRPTSRKYQY